jgi:DNA-binding response OmpR family regulator
VSTVPARLLVVEDNASTSFALRAFFQSAGYDVDVVPDRSSAIRLLDDKQYEVVITDLNLGSTQSNEGMDVVSDTRRRHAHACIIMLTAFGSAAAEHEARRRGADLFCAKPVALRDLSLFIDKALRRDQWPPAPVMEGGCW